MMSCAGMFPSTLTISATKERAMTRPDRRAFLGTAATAAVLTTAAAADEAKAPDRPGQTKNTKFAVNVEAWWSKLPFLARLEKTAELGFPAVEFWPWENKDIPAVA